MNIIGKNHFVIDRIIWSQQEFGTAISAEISEVGTEHLATTIIPCMSYPHTEDTNPENYEICEFPLPNGNSIWVAVYKPHMV